MKFKKIDEMTSTELSGLLKVSVGFIAQPIRDRKKVVGFRYKAITKFSNYLSKEFYLKDSIYNLLALRMGIVSGNNFRIDNCPVIFTRGLDANGNYYHLYEIKIADEIYIRDFFSNYDLAIAGEEKLPIKFIDRPEKEIASLLSVSEIKESK